MNNIYNLYNIKYFVFKSYSNTLVESSNASPGKHFNYLAVYTYTF